MAQRRLKQNFNEVQAILDAVGQKVDKIEGKGLSANDYTDTDKAKLDGIQAGAEANVIERIKRNGVALSPIDKEVDITVPTSLSNLSDDESHRTVTDTEKETWSGKQNDISGIIPSEASSANKLADKNYVNDAVTTASADFKGTFESVAELPATGMDKNDYAYVVSSDAAGNTVYNRYKYNGTSWVFEYSISSPTFSASEWAAIHSGMTEELRRKLENIPADAEANVQPDWNQDNSSADDFIKNKPDDLVHYEEVSPTDPINVPQYATEEEVSQLRSDVTAIGQEVTGYFYNENVSVNTNSQRFKSYTLDPGSKIVVRVSLVSGTSATINLYWIKAGGNVAILSGYPIGYMTDILTVPDDATGVQIFMTPAASGNVNKIEIWDATKAEYLTEKIGQFGLDFLNNRKMISKTVTIPANNSAMDLVSLNDGLLAGLSGDIYAYISCSPKIADDMEIQFWNTEDSASQSVGIHGIEMRQDRVFKIWNNKTFSRITVPANVVTTSTEVTIMVFAIVPSDTYLKYPLYGKKVMCFGDSITEFKTSIDNKRYTDHLQEYSQADVKNAGIGGTRLAQRLTPSLTPTDNQYCVAAFDICNMVIAWATGDYSLQDAALASGLLTSEQQSLYESKIAMLKDNPIAGFDIVTIMAGANDYRGGSPVGLENQETIDKGTIRGAINAMVSALLAAKPTIEINFFSPLILMMGEQVSLNNSSDVYIPTAAPDGMTFPAYIEKIHDAVKGNHCPFNDMYWSLGFNVYNFTTFFGDDLSHPYRGFRVIAERMYKYLLQR